MTQIVLLAALAISTGVKAFVSSYTTFKIHKSFSTSASSSSSTSSLFNVASDLNIPCGEECALDQFPSMPPSIHPGVLSGDGLMDLMADAKARGYAIPAVNCISSSSINSCLESARLNGSPIIVQFSAGGETRKGKTTITFTLSLSLSLTKLTPHQVPSSMQAKDSTIPTTPPPSREQFRALSTFARWPSSMAFPWFSTPIMPE